MIKNLVVISLLLTGIMHAQDGRSQLGTFHVTPKEHEKMKLLMLVIGECESQMNDLVALIKKDIEFSGQFEVTARSCKALHAKNDVRSLANEGYNLAVYINQSPRKQGFEWRLYDTAQAEMLKGKKYQKVGAHVRGWAHHIADMLWQELTGQECFFSTKIAYCKEVVNKNGKLIKHVYCADYDGSNPELMVGTHTINIAPRFGRDPHKPVIFYSESTRSNIRLMYSDMAKQRKVASNFDGINMLPSFSKDGKKMVYCASHGNGNCQLYYYEKGTFKQLTHNKGNNISPVITDDGSRVFYCSDHENGKPQIYCYDFGSDTHTNMSKCAESCFCPSYHSNKGMLAYVKMIKGTMQLCLYHEKTGVNQQLTFDAAHKDECSWSPCGNFLLYSIEQRGKGKIASLNLMTREQKILTAGHEVCSYPTWSPLLNCYPVLA